MTDSKKEPRPRRWRRAVASLLCLLVAILLAGPWFVANSTLRNVVIGRVAGRDGLQVTAQSADFGWLSPLRLRDVDVAGDEPQVAMQIKEIHFEKSWLATWLGLPGLGRIAVDSPQIEVVLPDGPVEVSSEKRSKPITGTFTARRIAFRVLLPDDPDPVIELNEFDVVSRIDVTDAGRVLSIEPVQILDETALTEEMCDQGLQLVAPLLAKTTAVNGAASLELTTFRVPLDGEDAGLAGEAAEVRGKLELHHVTAKLKDSILRDVTSLTTQLLRIDVPDELRIANNSEVAFHLREGRVYHDGLTFLLPGASSETVWKTRGSVGLDETLDLTVEVKLPGVAESPNELLRRLTAKPFTFKIAGTVDDPKLQLPENRDWLNETAEAVLGDGLSGDAEPLTDTMMDLLEQMRQRRQERMESNAPLMFERLRKRLRRRSEEREDAAPRFRPFRFRNPRRDRSGEQEEGGTDV